MSKTITVATVRKWLRWLGERELNPDVSMPDEDHYETSTFRINDYLHFQHHLGAYAGKCPCAGCDEESEYELREPEGDIYGH